jgi:hypothetical protein
VLIVKKVDVIVVLPKSSKDKSYCLGQALEPCYTLAYNLPGLVNTTLARRFGVYDSLPFLTTAYLNQVSNS